MLGWGEVKRTKKKNVGGLSGGRTRALCGRRIIGAMEQGLLASPGKELRFYFKGCVMGEFVKDYHRCRVRQMTLVIGIISRMRIRGSRTKFLARVLRKCQRRPEFHKGVDNVKEIYWHRWGCQEKAL